MVELNHPLDDIEFAQKRSGIRILCAGMIVALLGISIGVWLVVNFALEGRPLAGNLLLVGGISITTIIAVAVALVTPFAAISISEARTEAGLRNIAAGHPELIGSRIDVERLLTLFHSVVFLQFALAFGAAFASAVLLHITSDPILLGCIGLQVGFMILRFPTTTRTKRWYDRIAVRLAESRDAGRTNFS